jgi:hypothetical protein
MLSVTLICTTSLPRALSYPLFPVNEPHCFLCCSRSTETKVVSCSLFSREERCAAFRLGICRTREKTEEREIFILCALPRSLPYLTFLSVTTSLFLLLPPFRSSSEQNPVSKEKETETENANEKLRALLQNPTSSRLSLYRLPNVLKLPPSHTASTALTFSSQLALTSPSATAAPA